MEVAEPEAQHGDPRAWAPATSEATHLGNHPGSGWLLGSFLSTGALLSLDACQQLLWATDKCSINVPSC